MLGTVDGKPKTFITNVSVKMSHNFSTVMQRILKEANAGRFATKGDAVKRRDQLVGEAAPQAVSTAESQAAPAKESTPWYPEDGLGQLENSQGSQDVD